MRSPQTRRPRLRICKGKKPHNGNMRAQNFNRGCSEKYAVDQVALKREKKISAGY